jgi:hypothetical protein
LPKIFVHATSSLFFIAEPAPVRASVVCSLPNQRLFFMACWNDDRLRSTARPAMVVAPVCRVETGASFFYFNPKIFPYTAVKRSTISACSCFM